MLAAAGVVAQLIAVLLAWQVPSPHCMRTTIAANRSWPASVELARVARGRRNMAPGQRPTRSSIRSREDSVAAECRVPRELT